MQQSEQITVDLEGCVPMVHVGELWWGRIDPATHELVPVVRAHMAIAWGIAGATSPAPTAAGEIK